MNEDDVLQGFSKFGRDEFADWLWLGLRDFYTLSPAERVNSFQGSGWQILDHESVCEGLAQIYEEYVPPSKQLLFRQAIGDVLRKHANERNAPIDAFRDLIYLIMRIRADESLEALVPTVGTGFLGKREPDILYETIASLRSLAPSLRAYNTVRSLIRSANFNSGYLFEAVKILAECRPTNVSSILVELEPDLSRLFRRAARASNSRERVALRDAVNGLVKFLLTHSPSTWLTDFWEEASHTARQLWLFEYIYFNKAIPTSFSHDQSTDTYFVRYTDNEIPLKMPRKARWTRDYLLEKSTYDRSNRWSVQTKDKVYNRIHEWVKILDPNTDPVKCTV